MEDQMKPKAQSIIENIAKKEEASRWVVLCKLKYKSFRILINYLNI